MDKDSNGTSDQSDIKEREQFLIGKQGSDKILQLLTQGEPKQAITSFQNDNGLLKKNDMHILINLLSYSSFLTSFFSSLFTW